MNLLKMGPCERFLNTYIDVHVNDVMDMYINIGVQETFARPHFKLVHGISILIKKMVPLGQNTELQCIYIHRSL